MSLPSGLPRSLTLVALALSAAVLSGCSKNGILSSSPVTTVASAGSASVDVRHLAGYGLVLVTADGRALYLFSIDPKDGTACLGSCLLAWPPLLVHGEIKAGPGVDPRLLSSFLTHDGAHQVLYNGHALYTFEQDASAGMDMGEGVQTYGGTWWLVSPSGRPVTAGRG